MNLRLDYDKIERRLARKARKDKTSSNNASTVSVKNRTVVITGSIPNVTRRFITNALQTLHSTTVLSAINSSVHYLIVGDTKGADTKKIKDATTLNIPIVSYTKVKELIQ